MQKNETKFWKPEFILVVIMLIVLTALVILVLSLPVTGISKDSTTVNYDDLLDYRKSILAIILTAFGAWVGAGAAYFFGRENLREAASSLLQMREPSPRERLRRTPIREMPLNPLDWQVKQDEIIEDILKKLKDEPERWFIPIVNDDGTLNTVVHEEAFWRFLDNESEAGTAYNDIKQKKVSDVQDFLSKNADLKKKVEGIYVRVTLDKSAGDAYEQMQKKDVYLAVVLDKEGMGKPTHFITTGDVRTVLLQAG